MPPLDLTDDERAELIQVLRQIVDYDRFPLSPRVKGIDGDPGEAGAEAGAAASREATGRADVGAAAQEAKAMTRRCRLDDAMRRLVLIAIILFRLASCAGVHGERTPNLYPGSDLRTGPSN
jgi:hypothetical protein